MRTRALATAVALSGLLVGHAGPAFAANVKVTPLGSHDGEFCQFDRAMVFEDPDGTRLLYDAGRTVAGADDPRLGRIDALLVSHMHGDHVGDRHIPAPNAGACGKVDASVAAAPNTNTGQSVGSAAHRHAFRTPAPSVLCPTTSPATPTSVLTAPI